MGTIPGTNVDDIRCCPSTAIDEPKAKTELMQVICQGRPREQDAVAARLVAAYGSPMSSAIKKDERMN